MFCGTWTKVLLLLAKRGNRLPLREKVVLGGIMYPHASPKSCSLMNSSHVIFSCYTNSQKCDNNSVNYKSNPVRVKKQNGYAILFFGITTLSLKSKKVV
jgi:hypothetical protein